MEDTRNLLITLRFLGTRYHGFQVQQNALSISEVLQDAMEAALGVRDDIKGCSRTDSGVHAEMYCLSFKTMSKIPPDGMVKALNQRLPDDIAVKSIREVPPGFHARYSSCGKEYVYRILNAAVRDPFLTDTAFFYHRPLDIPLMQRAAAGMVGTYDCGCFCGSGAKEMASTVRTVSALSVERRGELVEIRVSANGFLYKMARTMVGTLIRVSEGRIPPEAIHDIIKSGDRNLAGFTAPAHGLCLSRVFYDERCFLMDE